MKRWIFLVALALILLGAGYVAYDYYRAGFHTRPQMPKGAFSISYENGMRSILVDVADEREARRYFGFPADVPFYLEDAWSFCRPIPRAEATKIMAYRERYPGERFEALCTIEVDDEIVIRGFISSVPRL